MKDLNLFKDGFRSISKEDIISFNIFNNKNICNDNIINQLKEINNRQNINLLNPIKMGTDYIVRIDNMGNNASFLVIKDILYNSLYHSLFNKNKYINKYFSYIFWTLFSFVDFSSGIALIKDDDEVVYKTSYLSDGDIKSFLILFYELLIQLQVNGVCKIFFSNCGRIIQFNEDIFSYIHKININEEYSYIYKYNLNTVGIGTTPNKYPLYFNSYKMVIPQVTNEYKDDDNIEYTSIPIKYKKLVRQMVAYTYFLTEKRVNQFKSTEIRSKIFSFNKIERGSNKENILNKKIYNLLSKVLKNDILKEHYKMHTFYLLTFFILGGGLREVTNAASIASDNNINKYIQFLKILKLKSDELKRSNIDILPSELLEVIYLVDIHYFNFVSYYMIETGYPVGTRWTSDLLKDLTKVRAYINYEFFEQTIDVAAFCLVKSRQGSEDINKIINEYVEGAYKLSKQRGYDFFWGTIYKGNFNPFIHKVEEDDIEIKDPKTEWQKFLYQELGLAIDVELQFDKILYGWCVAKTHDNISSKNIKKIFTNGEYTLKNAQGIFKGRWLKDEYVTEDNFKDMKWVWKQQ